jgi:undecaprenyl-diphosphatase
MTLLHAIILGLIQGLTEFIPVSSSGHLVLAHHFLNIRESGLSFDVALHLGTLLALVLYFYKDLAIYAVAIFTKRKETRLAWLLVMATVPAVIAGLLLEKAAESAFRSPRLVAINLALVACLMLAAEHYYHLKVRRPTKLKDTRRNQALAIGAAQAAAVLPGVSRSGSTILTGLFMGMDRVAATRFSFLLGIPITAGAILKVFTEKGMMHQIKSEQAIFAAGIVTAFVSGILAIQFMLRFLGRHSLATFAYYRFAVAAVVLLALLWSK